MSARVSDDWSATATSPPAGEGRDIELRHQRNPDVVFDCVRAVEGEAGLYNLLVAVHPYVPLPLSKARCTCVLQDAEGSSVQGLTVAG